MNTSQKNSTINIPWDWAGVIGTGQSLAVGEQGQAIQSLTQPYNNLKLSKDTLEWPIDPNNDALALVPLAEPINTLAPEYPSSWPANIAGETPHSAMANQITAMVRANHKQDHIGVHGNVGENGQCLIYLKKNPSRTGVNGRAFQASLVETQAIKRLAQAQGKTYGVAALIVTHGECDSTNTAYKSELYQLWKDYNNDIKAITGQNQDLLMILSQQHSQGDGSASTLAQWQAGLDHPENIVCAGPKYQYHYADDHVHMITTSYQQLGEKYAQVYYQRVILGNNWQPLQPLSIKRDQNIITVNFHVPVAPLCWESKFEEPHSDKPEWANGKGFEVRSLKGRETIDSVRISGSSVIITCARNLPCKHISLAYGMTQSQMAMTKPYQGTLRWGLLRDSDPFIGSISRKAQPNYAVAFELLLD